MGFPGAWMSLSTEPMIPSNTTTSKQRLGQTSSRLKSSNNAAEIRIHLILTSLHHG
eukprot:CAMPEP_0174965002 /NCGR_PEP_ID=MMETSP0004_2-20121128/6200_1 /TAXON_ID=420556 /ORGANISM="Ochromonas sp., Strain CCMP1393" /LENGTH=55 /DNA_ID=CAMNT_0016213803 /DNA_START=252 /DNA_END=415 /DNA_ORIENTATION=+